MISIDSQVAFETNRIESNRNVCVIYSHYSLPLLLLLQLLVLLVLLCSEGQSIKQSARSLWGLPTQNTVHPACLAPLCVHCVLCWATVIRLDHSTKKLNLHINIIWVLAGLLCLFPPSLWLHFTTLHAATAVVLFIKRKQQQTV